MAKDKINGKDLKIMINNGAINLANNHKHIDDLNVFPVPDGDTGTNMNMTISAGVSEVESLETYSIHEVAKKLSRGLLMGARGNSGVILSQLFRGMSIGINEKEEVGSLDLLEMFDSAQKQAYKAVMNPVEGTILTVARVASEETAKQVTYKTTPIQVFEIYLKEAMKALDNTPNLLDKLKEAGVVDSGGAGYVLVIEGMYKALKGEFIKPNSDVKFTITQKSSTGEDVEFGYCTEFIILLKEPSKSMENYVKSKLSKIGDSIVVVQDEDLLKVHVHTIKPGDALNICQKYGEFQTLKIENMSLQHEEIINYKEKEEPKKYGIITVAQGEGLVQTFYDFGVDEVITGGQTMNPSTQDFIDSIKKINAENILIFPNNKNILLAAEQAKNLVDDKNIIVINSLTIPTGYTSISLLELSYEPEEIKEAIESTIEHVKTGELTFAVRDTTVDGIEIHKDDFMSIIDGKIVYSNANKSNAVYKLMDEILKNSEICTVIYGKHVRKEEINDIEEYVNKKHPNVEIDFIDGGQDVYSFLLSVE